MATSTKKEDENVKDKNIFQYIDRHQWNKVVQLISIKPEVASLTKKDSLIHSDNLPIHEACKNQPPKSVVEILLRANPDSIWKKGQWGYLPLHYACSSTASNDVVTALISSFPGGARTRDETNKFLPIHLACKWGAKEDVIMTLLSAYPEAIYAKDSKGMTPIDHAVNDPAESTRTATMNILKQGSTLCSISKGAYDRATTENKMKLNGMKEAHAAHVMKIESRHVSHVAELEARYKERIDDLTSIIDNLRSELEVEKSKEKKVEEMIAEKGRMESLVDELNDTVASLRHEIIAEQEKNAELTEINNQQKNTTSKKEIANNTIGYFNNTIMIESKKNGTIVDDMYESIIDVSDTKTTKGSNADTNFFVEKLNYLCSCS